jgi:hypothetical protein
LGYGTVKNQQVVEEYCREPGKERATLSFHYLNVFDGTSKTGKHSPPLLKISHHHLTILDWVDQATLGTYRQSISFEELHAPLVNHGYTTTSGGIDHWWEF